MGGVSELERARVINALVAEHVFHMWVSPDRLYADHAPLRAYSEDIGAAWAGVEYIERHKGWYVEVGWCNGMYGPKKRAWCEIAEYGDSGHSVALVNADTVPHAICLAILEALGIPVPA